MEIKQKILQFITKKKFITSSELAIFLNVSCQYASRILQVLVNSGEIVKIGSTRSAHYTLPRFLHEIHTFKSTKRLTNKHLAEHEVMETFLVQSPPFRTAPEHVQSILRYAFSEMLNNAIDHSQSRYIDVKIAEDTTRIVFEVSDFGIGVFRNVMKKNKLKTPFEAMQDLLKGKVTTQPKAHSGEGIFFTSKLADSFLLESFAKRMRVDNVIEDVSFEDQKPSKKGTRVIFSIAKKSKRHLNTVFEKYQSHPGSYAFDKTEIRVRLFTMGTVYVSRSQAKRVLSGLEKFNTIVFDFARVPTIGQAFADEIFRVFSRAYPRIRIEIEQANEAVAFMIQRVKNEVKKNS